MPVTPRKSADLKADRIPFAGGDEWDFVQSGGRRACYLKPGRAKRVKRSYSQRRRQLVRQAIRTLPPEELNPFELTSEEEYALEVRIAYKQHYGEPLTLEEWEHTDPGRHYDMDQELEDWARRNLPKIEEQLKAAPVGMAWVNLAMDPEAKRDTSPLWG